MAFGFQIAVAGCGHGELDKIYAGLRQVEQRERIKVDLLLVCGDFQAVRNEGDLATMACPAKYRQMNTFYKYYTGKAEAPVLTIYIGGNHEASNYHAELFWGGWVCKNIYYMGAANVLKVGNLRIGGLTGIFNAKHFRMGHFEKPPFDNNSMRSVYHVRELEVFRLLQVHAVKAK